MELGAVGSLTQQGAGRRRMHDPMWSWVGHQKRHSLILGCDFVRWLFKWTWFIEIMTHQLLNLIWDQLDTTLEIQVSMLIISIKKIKNKSKQCVMLCDSSLNQLD